MNLTNPNRGMLQKVPGLNSALDKIMARIGGIWGIEHNPDGSHGAITATSLETTGDATVGGEATVDGPANIDGIEISSAIDGAGTSNTGPGIKLPAGTQGGDSWSIVSALDNFNEVLSISNETQSTRVLALYRHTASKYSLGPGTGDGFTNEVNLGDNTTSDFRWDNAYLRDCDSTLGYKERGRSTAAGEWTAVAYDAGNFTASAGTWTVDEADQLTYAYSIVGKSLTVSFEINASDVSAAPASLNIAIPAGFVSARRMRNCISANDAGVLVTAATAFCAAGGTVIELYKDLATTAWTATSSDNTYVAGQITIEIQ